MPRATKKPAAFASLLPMGLVPEMPHVLYTGDGMPASPETIRKAAMVVCLRDLSKSSALNAPAATRAFLASRMSDLPCEVFAALFLDNRHRLIEYRELFRGTVDGASVHPREVVREALSLHGCAALIFAHNHPSGVADASQADELITRRLRDALALVDIRVLDHFIIGASGTLSFAERGLL